MGVKERKEWEWEWEWEWEEDKEKIEDKGEWSGGDAVKRNGIRKEERKVHLQSRRRLRTRRRQIDGQD